MTREETIEALKYSIGIFPVTDRAVSALDMAIKALEQEPCEDAISREFAIDTLCEGLTCYDCSFNKWGNNDMGCLLKERIRNAPSVTPKQRTGHWIFEKGDGKTCVDGYVCSACNKSFHTHVPYFAEYKYCPNCGCRMVEPQESEEQEREGAEC